MLDDRAAGLFCGISEPCRVSLLAVADLQDPPSAGGPVPDETDSYDTAATMMPFPAGTIMAVTKQFLKAVGYWPAAGQDDEAQDEAIAILRKQILYLDGQVQQLYSLINDLNRRVAHDENVRRLDKLAAALDSARKTTNRIAQRPATRQEWQELAFEAVVDADRF